MIITLIHSVLYPGSVEYISSTGDEYNIHLTTPGVYYFTVEVTDDQAVVHTDFLAVELLDPVALDVLLQNKWSGMKTALLVLDIDTALTFHLEKFHEKYSYIYNALGSELSAHAQDMQPISAVYMIGVMPNTGLSRIMMSTVRQLVLPIMFTLLKIPTGCG